MNKCQNTIYTYFIDMTGQKVFQSRGSNLIIWSIKGKEALESCYHCQIVCPPLRVGRSNMIRVVSRTFLIGILAGCLVNSTSSFLAEQQHPQQSILAPYWQQRHGHLNSDANMESGD